jgi:hypothetical protein
MWIRQPDSTSPTSGYSVATRAIDVAMSVPSSAANRRRCREVVQRAELDDSRGVLEGDDVARGRAC